MLATAAYKKKSNHSIDEPIKLADKTFVRSFLSIVNLPFVYDYIIMISGHYKAVLSLS